MSRINELIETISEAERVIDKLDKDQKSFETMLEKHIEANNGEEIDLYLTLLKAIRQEKEEMVLTIFNSKSKIDVLKSFE
ncbi:hypothetical protein [Petrocella sp. FN5]|uniref:hypothetical protein n=1 Tax=Petrocella sp. FN5 TaxID=3032002 RepID=UPI0023DB951B|nr:hypothetical protein [Petrocella sp. FN5]MDF1618561.1 hypothetical protein [Petrocella sp. FN5]